MLYLTKTISVRRRTFIHKYEKSFRRIGDEKDSEQIDDCYDNGGDPGQRDSGHGIS